MENEGQVKPQAVTGSLYKKSITFASTIVSVIGTILAARYQEKKHFIMNTTYTTL